MCLLRQTVRSGDNNRETFSRSMMWKRSPSRLATLETSYLMLSVGLIRLYRVQVRLRIPEHRCRYRVIAELFPHRIVLSSLRSWQVRYSWVPTFSTPTKVWNFKILPWTKTRIPETLAGIFFLHRKNKDLSTRLKNKVDWVYLRSEGHIGHCGVMTAWLVILPCDQPSWKLQTIDIWAVHLILIFILKRTEVLWHKWSHRLE